ncbi:MAG TPA: tRNA pseudouridine(38-40) synthase TruA [bacterium]
MRNVKITIEYDGTTFFGWQRLTGRPTVQAALERAASRVTGEPVKIVGASRTDAGVHALGQVANFKTQSHLAAVRFPAALNAYLPETVRIVSAEDVDDRFHARFSATGRIYRYAILNRSAPSAILRNHAYHVATALVHDAMAAAAANLQGTHEFTAFRSAGSGERTTVCTLRRAAVARSGDMVICTFEADRFLRHMVRLMVGVLLRVGQGKLTAEAVETILSSGRNQKAGPRVPAHGLYLVSVLYAESLHSHPHLPD